MDKLLDLIHRNKRLIGLLLVGLAAAAKAADQQVLADAILTVGTLSGVGYLPNGPNPVNTIPPK